MAPIHRRTRERRAPERDTSRDTIHEGDDVAPVANLRELTAATLIDLSVLENRSHGTPRAVGGFDVILKLAEQGNVEVLLAEKCSPHGIKKRALVKRIARWAPDFDRHRAALLDEARVTAGFSHPNLTTLIDVGEDAHAAYLALEHLEGTTLQKLNHTLRARHRALPFELSCFIIAEALRGLHYAHTLCGPDGRELQVVLRDRTPANLLISSTGNIKLTDFALALTKTRNQNPTQAGLVKGTYAYLSPEYIAGAPCSVRSDIYSMGVMLFELLAGRECFGGETAYQTLEKIVEKGVVWQRLEREGVPVKLMEIVARATNPCPGGRYESALEMLEALEEQLMSLGRAATPTVLARTLCKYELIARASVKPEPGEEKKYIPQLRFVRGESVVVTQAQAPAGPPPPPARTINPLEADDTAADEPSEDKPIDLGEEDLAEEVSLSDVFMPAAAPSTPSIPSIPSAPNPSHARPPIAPPNSQIQVPIARSSFSDLIVIQQERTEAPLVLIVAALVAIALFVAIVSYPA